MGEIEAATQLGPDHCQSCTSSDVYEEITSLSVGTAVLVAAAHPASDPRPSRNRQHLPESKEGMKTL